MRPIVPLALFSLLLIPATVSAAETGLRTYLESHCFDCHDSATKKGGLDLESLPMQFDAAEFFDTWAKAHDRIAAGEMPPKSRQERPSDKENAVALKLLDDRLHEVDSERVAKTGRALFRRLSAQEYENALRDLLHLPSLRIKHLLPEDERRHGYNKIGQALDLSNVHLNQFMDAADLALASAVATRSTPPPVLRKRFGGTTGTETWNWVARGDAVLLKDKQFDPLLPLPAPGQDLWGAKGSADVKRRNEALGNRLREYEGAIGYFTGPIERTFSLSLQFSPVHAGTYRIRTSAWGFWWDSGMVESPHRNESFMLSVWLLADGPRFIHSPSRRLGMFDVPSLESRVHEYVGWFDVNEELFSAPRDDTARASCGNGAKANSYHFHGKWRGMRKRSAWAASASCLAIRAGVHARCVVRCWQWSVLRHFGARWWPARTSPLISSSERMIPIGPANRRSRLDLSKRRVQAWECSRLVLWRHVGAAKKPFSSCIWPRW
jgi:hypothetical protein